MCVMHICDGGGNTTIHNPRHLPPLLSFADTHRHTLKDLTKILMVLNPEVKN